MKLSKLHATGNDFLVRMADDAGDVLDTVTVAALCDRHRGIGADGVITIGGPGADHDCSMLLQNADGGVAEMSGNGIRCLAWVAAARGLARGRELVVATGGGRRELALEFGERGVVSAAIDMGPAVIGEVKTFSVGGSDLDGMTVDMGNPHIVFVVDDPDAIDVSRDGSRIEHDPTFPHRTNVEFAIARDRHNIAMRVWERGAGETLSCGTGVCASAAALRHVGLVDERVSVHVPGGVLAVEVGATVRLTGPVVHVFDVDIDRDHLLATLR